MNAMGKTSYSFCKHQAQKLLRLRKFFFKILQHLGRSEAIPPPPSPPLPPPPPSEYSEKLLFGEFTALNPWSSYSEMANNSCYSSQNSHLSTSWFGKSNLKREKKRIYWKGFIGKLMVKTQKSMQNTQKWQTHSTPSAHQGISVFAYKER